MPLCFWFGRRLCCHDAATRTEHREDPAPGSITLLSITLLAASWMRSGHSRACDPGRWTYIVSSIRL